MKHVYSGALIVVILVMNVSCLSLPDKTASGASKNAQAVAVSAPVAVTDAPVAPGEPVAETPTAGAPAQDATVPSEPAVAEPAVIEPVPDPVQTPSISEDEPEVPPSERLLYFYPEPDPLFIQPVAPAVKKDETAKPAATVKPAPAAKTAVKAPETAVKPAAAETSDAASGKTKAEDALPGIWESEPVAPAIKSVPAAAKAEPSRTVSLGTGQTLEVWYPGSGWVYLGDVSAQNGLGYENRKLDKNDTLFSFKALKAGSYILEFTRFDVIEDTYASDLLAVTVTDDNTKKSGKQRAPDYRSPVPASTASGATGIAVSAATATALPATSAASPVSANGNLSASSALAAPVSATASTSSGMRDEPSLVSTPVSSGQAPKSLDPAALLDDAKKSLASGDAPGALAKLDTFFGLAVDSLDEGWYLRGQAYEANSASRDIRKALDAYETLIAAWPESTRWNAADARIRYIRQFYQGR